MVYLFCQAVTILVQAFFFKSVVDINITLKIFVHYLYTMNLPRTVPDFRQVSNCSCSALHGERTWPGQVFLEERSVVIMGGRRRDFFGTTLSSSNFSALCEWSGCDDQEDNAFFRDIYWHFCDFFCDFLDGQNFHRSVSMLMDLVLIMLELLIICNSV